MKNKIIMAFIKSIENKKIAKLFLRGKISKVELMEKGIKIKKITE